MDYVEVAPEVAKEVLAGKSADWKKAILDGKMISMVHRPSWTASDTAATGLRMRTRQYKDEAGERRFYIWAEKVSAKRMTNIVVAQTPPDFAESIEDDDMPVPL